MTDVPTEVEKSVTWYFGGPVEPEDIRCYPKDEYSRGCAWDKVPIEEGNPWRKCHTKNYWVWVRRAK